MKKAFTLIELLIVVLIIGILSAIALPQYQKAVVRSRCVKGMVTLQALSQAQREYKLANGVYGGDTESLSIYFDDTVTCGNYNTYVGCSIPIAKTNIYFAWIGYHESTGYRWECHVPEDDVLGNQICSTYQREWGGNGGYSQNGRNYYYIGRFS